jgi:hypothetical protein
MPHGIPRKAEYDDRPEWLVARSGDRARTCVGLLPSNTLCHGASVLARSPDRATVASAGLPTLAGECTAPFSPIKQHVVPRRICFGTVSRPCHRRERRSPDLPGSARSPFRPIGRSSNHRRSPAPSVLAPPGRLMAVGWGWWLRIGALARRQQPPWFPTASSCIRSRLRCWNLTRKGASRVGRHVVLWADEANENRRFARCGPHRRIAAMPHAAVKNRLRQARPRATKLLVYGGWVAQQPAPSPRGLENRKNA